MTESNDRYDDSTHHSEGRESPENIPEYEGQVVFKGDFDGGGGDTGTSQYERLRPDCFDCGSNLYRAGTTPEDWQGWVCEDCGSSWVIDRIGRKWDTSELSPELNRRIELALADLKLLYMDGEHDIDGVTVDLLPGARELLERESWP